ncbi:MAG: cysteine desulfurase [Devosiaceae bacterium]|nr:cysteine desulfurase [Devosiaceae bacterium]
MTKPNIYLDHNASAPLLANAKLAMINALNMVGNPSAIHSSGRALGNVIENARGKIAKATGANASQVVFTGSATESISQAIIGGVKALKIDRIIISQAEHAACLQAANASGAQISEVFLLDSGLIDVAQLKEILIEVENNNEVALICVHEVNNETGIIQPIKQIETLVGATRHYLFVDSVQAFGKLQLDFASRPIDMMAISSHKVGGPVGIGAILMKSHCDEVVFIAGGGQEKGRRGGTLSAPLIAGFGEAAIEFYQEYDVKKIADFVAQIETGLKALSSELVIFGEDANRMGNIVNFAIPKLKASVIMMGLDLEGVEVSSGSACSSGKVTYSHVLCAMGISPELATGRIRISLGWNSTQQDVDEFLSAFKKILQRFKQAQNEKPKES